MNAYKPYGRYHSKRGPVRDCPQPEAPWAPHDYGEQK